MELTGAEISVASFYIYVAPCAGGTSDTSAGTRVCSPVTGSTAGRPGSPGAPRDRVWWICMQESGQLIWAMNSSKLV